LWRAEQLDLQALSNQIHIDFEFRKDTVAGGIDEPAAMLLDVFAKSRTSIVE